MSGRLDLELGAESLERSKVDLVVAGFFVDELPLRGGAGRVDWRLCGLVSDQILEGRIRGERGEALLVPAAGQLRANKVMVLGLGTRSQYRLQQISESTEQAISRALSLASPSLAMAPLGLAGDEFSRCAEAIIAGAIEGFGDCASGLRLRLVVPRSEINRAAQSIEASLDVVGTPAIRFRRPAAAAASSQAHVQGLAAR